MGTLALMVAFQLNREYWTVFLFLNSHCPGFSHNPTDTDSSDTGTDFIASLPARQPELRHAGCLFLRSQRHSFRQIKPPLYRLASVGLKLILLLFCGPRASFVTSCALGRSL